MSVSTPLRILCLHGYMQNGQVLRRKMGVLRKKLKTTAELVFVTAPHPVPMPANITDEERARLQKLYDSDELHPYAWWTASDDGTKYRGADEAFDKIKTTLAQEGPFDGIFGFSQGAVFASMLASVYGVPDHPLRCGSRHPAFRFAIMVSGFKARSPDYHALYAPAIQCPSFHVIGKEDTVVPATASETLAELFERPTIYRHDGG
ncbi:serine hydrolase FSH [Syncephalis pseudoplumigaleata]|uniref:Serine hydrolase FSH n=1 Tax=Syncephalis pseudoplumigaleata TaxID=1712513 RepID=A0A4P9Z5G3_9FUNG|nr:serine hydrolase FSH [Syncephalis pseudoplumigaleata]|eukprot:RKP27755.1 serine hydrolase FSH [Syncephalis pseudoplumigaleata]